MSAEISFTQDPSKISSFVSEKDYESAFLWAEAFFLRSSVEEKKINEACTLLETLLPSLSNEKQEILLQQACEKISEFPNLHNVHADLLARYGELSLKNDSSPIITMRSFASSCSVSPHSKLFVQMSELLRGSSLPFERFARLLQQAAGKGLVSEFQRLLESIPFLHQKFSAEATDLQQYYQIAREVYQKLNNKNKAKFVHLLDLITSGLRVEEALDPSCSLAARYREKLESIRTLYKREGDVRVLQGVRAQAFREFFASLFDDAFYILGEPPCKYEIRAMGSLAREENCPFSDIEYYILIENEEHRPYFKKLAELFDLQILSLGETDPKYQSPMFSIGQIPGLEIDHQANPAYHEELIGTLDRLFALPDDYSDADSLKAYKSRLQSVTILGNHSFELPEHDLSEYAKTVLDMRQEEFSKLQILQGDKCSIKQEFMEPLFHYLGDLGLYYGLEEKNTLNLIEILPPFTRLSKKLLKEAATSLYQLRVALHMESRTIQEEASLVPSLELPVLSAQEKKDLETIHRLVLLPLYRTNLDETRVDFLAIAFRQPTIELIQASAMFLQEQPFEIHARYYRMLSSPTHIEFQEAYLAEVPKKWVSRLAEIPNRAGYRLSRKSEEKDLKKRFARITTREPTTGVKIGWPNLEEKLYLQPEAAKVLLNESGRIKKRYSDSLHNVNEFGGLHFKELPYQPLMEYAVYSFTHRIMGKAAPATTLARFEIPSKNLVYPVLVSETIEGERIYPKTPLNQDHLTWLRLCELLTKPGDGRPSNYLVKGEKVYCVDNDISFMEPVHKSKGKRKVDFTSTLFTLEEPLSPEVLEAFCQLEPDLILKDWLEDLQKREEEYFSLFPNSQELQAFYEQDKERRFSPTLLLPKGTIATICLQFYQLQDTLRNNTPEDPLLLLRELISLEGTEKNQVGPLIERNYRKALAKPFEKRLVEATSSRQDQSMTSQKAMQLNYKKIPAFEEILERRTYSLEEALQELCLLEVQKLWNKVFVVEKERVYTLEADFRDVADPEREKLLLKGIQFLYEAKESKPTSLTLRNTKTLNPVLLGTLFHPGLHSLDLSYGMLISETRNIRKRLFSLIEELSPNLEELHLEGCPSLNRVTLTLSKLKRLNLSHNPNVQSIKVIAPELQELKIHHCPMLETLDVPLEIETTIDWKETPRLQDIEFGEKLFLLGNRFAEGKGVVRDPHRALTLWEKAAMAKHPKAQEIMKWKTRMSDFSYCNCDSERSYPYFAMFQNRITIVDIKLISSVLKVHLYLTTLSLGNHRIGDEGAEKISEALMFNGTLLSLNLYWNEIGDRGAKALADALRVNRALKKLDLSANDIKEEGGIALAASLEENASLETLNLSYNKINDEACNALQTSLKTNRSLKKFQLQHNRFGNGLARVLAASKEAFQFFEVLDLGENTMTRKGLKRFAPLLGGTIHLRKLRLECCQIGDQGVKILSPYLKQHDSLEELDLSSNKIGDLGAEYLAYSLKGSHHLKILNLESNWIHKKGAEALASLLLGDSSLVLLNLNYNSLGKGGAKALALPLKENQTLKSLNLYQNGIGDKGCVAIAGSLCDNHTLLTLNLGNNGFQEEGGEALAKMLETNLTLKILILNQSSTVLKTLAHSLKENASLESLALQEGGLFSEKGVEFLIAAFLNSHSLVSLDLGYRNSGIDIKCAHAIGALLENCKSLAFLNLTNSHLRDEGLKALVPSLKIHRNLVKLNLSRSVFDNYKGYEGIKAFASFLKKNTTLTDLDLSENILFTGDKEYLFDALKSNHSLVRLRLLSNSEKNGVLLDELIERNRTLQDWAFGAAAAGSARLYEFLDQGVSLYSQDSHMNTFLHLAAKNGQADLILPLLERAENPTFANWRNKNEKTALDIARKYENREIISLLSS